MGCFGCVAGLWGLSGVLGFACELQWCTSVHLCLVLFSSLRCKELLNERLGGVACSVTQASRGDCVRREKCERDAEGTCHQHYNPGEGWLRVMWGFEPLASGQVPKLEVLGAPC